MYEKKFLPNLLTKLCILFDIFLHYNILIQPSKFHLNYPDIALLGRWVNFLGLSTFEEKLKVVYLLRYLETLVVLKNNLGLIRYLESYIYYYTQLAYLL